MSKLANKVFFLELIVPIVFCGYGDCLCQCEGLFKNRGFGNIHVVGGGYGVCVGNDIVGFLAEVVLPFGIDDFVNFFVGVGLVKIRAAPRPLSRQWRLMRKTQISVDVCLSSPCPMPQVYLFIIIPKMASQLKPYDGHIGLLETSLSSTYRNFTHCAGCMFCNGGLCVVFGSKSLRLSAIVRT